jgi:GT2 family glycosyltransferase
MEPGKFELSVVIPTFNRLPVLRETLMRIVMQEFPREKFELIIIDDCSLDGTAEFLAGLKLPVNVKYLLNKQNLGRARSRNLGIREARGKYILMIDDDIWAETSLLEKHFNKHQEESEEIGVVGAVLASPEVIQTAINERYNNHHLWCFQEMNKYPQNLPYNFCKTANLSIPKTLVERVGLFSELFLFYGGEDTEFGYRLFKNNIRLVFASEAIGYHYHNETVESLITKEIERGTTYFTYQQIHPDHKLERSTFFSPFYCKEFNIRSILYNFAKMILFMPSARLINRLVIESFNQCRILRSLVVKYLIPILQMQYYRYGIKRVMQ